MKTKVFLSLVGCGIVMGARAVDVITTGAMSASGAGHSMAPSLSADGRYVVFVSHANNLVTNDDLRPFLDVFVRDLQTSTTTLISVNTNGTGGGVGDSSHASISANGRYVLFSSDANNLVGNDTNGAPDVAIRTNRFSDIFLRDVIAGVTTLVSVNTNGSGARGDSRRPIMTPDARFVVFQSGAGDLVAGEGNYLDLFIRDMNVGVTRPVAPRVNENLSGRTHSASVSADGRRIAFISTATNLGPNEVNQTGDVYVRDVPSATTYWASSNLTTYFNTVPNSYRCLNSIISPDGAKVAFKAVGPDGIAVHVLVHDIDAGSTTGVATNSRPDTWPAFSADGRWLAFEENNAIYLRDVVNGTNLLVTVTPGGMSPADGVSLRPVLSPDARHVAFVSSASNLRGGVVPSSTNLSRIYVRDVVAGVTRLISEATNGVPSKTDMHAILPAISADGRVVFDTDAPDIVANDNNKSSDIFVERPGAATGLVSVRHPERPARTGVQSAGLDRNSVSADGRRVAFSSFDDPRFPGDTNGIIDSFVYDAPSGQRIPQSGPEGPFPSGLNHVEPQLSANGEYVVNVREYVRTFQEHYFDFVWRKVDQDSTATVFATNAAGFAGEPGVAISSNGTVVAYGALTIHDLIANTNRVFRNAGIGVVNAVRHQFSPDEHWVVFSGPPPSTFWAMDVNADQFARPIVVSMDSDGIGRPALNGSFERTGRYYFFETRHFVPARIYRFDFQTTNSTSICTNCSEFSINPQGTLMAAVRKTSIGADVVLYDFITGIEMLISRDYAGTGGGNGVSSFPLLTPDGRYIVFTSLASNLVPNDTNRLSDVFVHDRLQNTTVLLTPAYDGARSGNGQSTKAVMSKDGRTVFFQSFAGDLVEGDYNERRDIFVVKLGVGDSDNDGMDDDWEVAQFGNLDRDGAGDHDSDGQTDLEEFVAGTNPTNAGSILRVLTVTPVTGASTIVVWSAVVGRSYVVQYKDSFDTNWLNASSLIEANSTSMSFIHHSFASRRFYRVVTVP